MHFFLVNDDGIGSKGIMALLHAAVGRGHQVTMCAPAAQQSAASGRITLTDPIYVREYPTQEQGVKAYAITGTPTDCVRVGLFHLAEKPVDVLISGINDGYNAGMAVHYSGTVGAAREGALNYLPAIASSIAYHATPTMLAHLAEVTIRAAEQLGEMKLPRAAVLNINAPLREPGELLEGKLAPLSTANYIDRYVRRESPRSGVYYWLDTGSTTEPFSEGTDQDLLEKGHVTFTVIGNPTDHSEGFEQLPMLCR